MSRLRFLSANRSDRARPAARHAASPGVGESQGWEGNLEKRFGSLVRTSWVPQFEGALGARKRLGIDPCGAELILAILLSHRKPRVWEAIAQETLAKRRGVSRTTVTKEIKTLRRMGMLAVRPDQSRRPSRWAQVPYVYCLDPYLAALAKYVAEGPREASLQKQLTAEAQARFARFVREVQLGQWEWWLGDLRSSSPREIEEMTRAFAATHQLAVPKRTDS